MGRLDTFGRRGDVSSFRLLGSSTVLAIAGHYGVAKLGDSMTLQLAYDIRQRGRLALNVDGSAVVLLVSLVVACH